LNSEFVFGDIVSDKKRYFLKLDNRKYSIHFTDFEKIKGMSKGGGMIFIYSKDLANFMEFDGYVYPGTICKIGDGKSKEHSS
jgi:hypothetical protein